MLGLFPPNCIFTVRMPEASPEGFNHPSLMSMRLLLFFFLIAIGSSKAQNLVSYSLRQSLSVEELKNEYDPNTPLERGVDIYVVLYVMNDVHGQPDTASGALSIPWKNEGEQFPLLCDMHGTTDRTYIPSAHFHLGPAFASHGFIVAEPDYLGLGNSRGFHPYVHAESEAMAGIEMLRAVKEVLADLGIQPMDELFISGYSQGGHSAMAMHRMIQQDLAGEFTVTASSPMSGPYSLSGIMFEKMMADLNYIPGIAFMPYLVLSYQEVYGNIYSDLTDIFKPQYIGPIQQFRDGSTTLSAMGTSLFTTLLLNTGTLKPRNMLQDDVRQQLLTDPTVHPIWAAITDNDLLNWVPEAPMRLFYCEADEQVPYQNSILAMETFQDGGASDVLAESKGVNLNHGGCVTPAAQATVDFFRSFLVSSTDEVIAGDSLELFPNPSSQWVHIRHAGTREYPQGELAVYDLHGRLVRQDLQFTGSFDVSQLSPGMYQCQVRQAGSTVTLRFTRI